jgi:low temperature requirement protein LtrA
VASEKPPILVVRRSGFLQAASPLDEEMIRALPAGVNLKIKVTQPRRSVPQHRLYWAFISLVAENLDQDVSPDTLHEWFKLRCGVVKEIRLRNGEIITVPGSTSFDKMEHADFNLYFTQVKDLVINHLIPRADCEAFEREALNMIGLS